MQTRKVRSLAIAVLLLASCQTSGQAKIVTVSATGVALVGGYLEHETRGSEQVPVSLIFGGIVAVASFASIFILDDFPRLEDGDRWRPDTYRHGSELLAALQRTGCFGPCPVYSLAVYRDGTVEFHGRANVSVCGKSVGKVSTEKLSELERQLIDARVTSMNRSYEELSLTDASTAYLWFRPTGGRTKGIAHYLGDLDAPEALLRAEKAVDAAANVEQWTGGGVDQTCK